MATGARAQPQGFLRAAHNNPYGKRLIAAATPTGSLWGSTRRASVTGGGPLGIYTSGGAGSYVQSARNAPIFLGRQGGAAADNANLSFVIVATNIAANTWFYDGQESGGQSARLQTDGSNNLAWFDGTRQQISGAAIPAGARVICISGGVYNGVAPKVWFDGVLGFTGTTDTSGHWNPTPAFRSLFGSGAFPGSNTFNGKGYMLAVLRGVLTDADAAALSANPWQVFDDPAQTQARAVAAAAITGTLAGTLDGATIAATGLLTAQGALASTLDGATLAAAGQASTPPSGSVASTLDGAVLAASGNVADVGMLASTLTGCTMAASGIILDPGSFANTLAGASMAASGQVITIPSGTLNSTLDGAALAAGGYVGTPPAGPNFFIRLPKNPRHVLPH